MNDVRVGSSVIEVSSGKGPDVLMFHGLGGTSNAFQTLTDSLGAYRVVRPDLPGAGRSTYRPGLPGFAGLLSPARDCLRGKSGVHLVGHSMGALICQHLAAEYPDLIASLSLFGPVDDLSPDVRSMFRQRAATVRREGMSGVAESVSQTGTRDVVARAYVRESLMRQDPRGYAAHCEALASSVPADHARIQCPTLLITGTEDMVAPPTLVRSLAAKIAGAQLEIIADVGHWPMIEAPEDSTRLLLTHLGSPSVQRRMS